MSDATTIDLAVVGAGLAGLAAAQLARRAGLSVTVLDGGAPGGRARTDSHDGFLFNRGPHALYRNGHAERILRGLGVAMSGGPPSSVVSGSVDGDVVALPAGTGALLRSRLVGMRGKVALARLLGSLPKLDPTPLGDISFASWLERRAVPADARRLVEALARVATYSQMPEAASADMVLGQLQLAMGSGVRYLDGGWQTLVDGLASGLEIRRVGVAAVATPSRRAGGEYVEVHCHDGTTVIARAAILATGTPAAAAALTGRPPFDVGPPIEASCLDLGTTTAPRTPFLLGIDAPLYLSNHCPPARLAPAGGFVVHVARYLRPEDALTPAEQRAELVAHALRAGVAPEHVAADRYLHRMTVAGALPTAMLGGLRGRPAVTDSGQRRVLLAGDWVGPEGHLLDAALASSASAVSAAVRLCAE